MSGTQTASRFAHLLSTTPGRSGAVWDARLLESANFVAAPSKGSLVPGWVLLIPKRHVFSFRELTSTEMSEAENLVEGISRTLNETFGPVIVFEHGAAYSGSALGCGVDHAHLHIVPLDVDLLSETLSDATLKWRAISHWSAIRRQRFLGKEYLMISDMRGNAFAAEAAASTSQYFRKLIAKLLGKQAQWNYRTNPFEANARATVQAFYGDRLEQATTLGFVADSETPAGP